MTLGVDYPWTHPDPAALQDAGVQFAMRYLSTDPSKNLTRAEADALAAHGIWSGVVWETTASRALAGQAAGVADAQAALSQATACGMPPDRPIYFAVDTDTDWASVQPYFAGATSVLSAARTGIYAGLRVVQGAAGSGLVTWFWQASAWSGGVWDPRAHIRQLLAGLTVGGVDCDQNAAMTADFGQWMPGKSPTPVEVDMPLTDDEINRVAAAVWNFQLNALKADGSPRGNTLAAFWFPTWRDVVDARNAAAFARIETAQTAESAAVSALAAQLGAAHGSLDTAAVITAVQQAIAAATVHVDVQVGPKPAA